MTMERVLVHVIDNLYTVENRRICISLWSYLGIIGNGEWTELYKGWEIKV